MRKFEHRILHVTPDSFWSIKIDAQELTDTLNELGRQGWEVVSAVDTDISGTGVKALMFVLKRELP
ncbi:DUF4177 domain-containing protein [Spirosoma sp. KUDC1026]|uniref:DUF4177 domain-containing protein n=1 Tax=Spirosoma sp. KUDC1026 TaxID=2745947 RepID=UPI00159BCBB7|nr:DUF4177 domain-containing protein [Spirosoma sp. KUDC1026]QKZ15006.1 DUF4177 domain-containing protein [Spirosoma sp. KUDC1026]